MDTFFAPAEKANEKDLVSKIEIVNESPVMSGLLHSISGLLAVLNEHRQVIALNDSFMQMLRIDDSVKALGLRPGEVLQCLHAHDEPSGCGTTKFCSTCGAAIAIVTSLEQDKPVEKICALSANRDGKVLDLALLVKSHPILINNKKFLLLFLQDITQQQQSAALARTFFHDVNNMITMLLGASELLVKKDPSKLANMIHQASYRLTKEVAIQQYLSQTESCNYQPVLRELTADQIIEELQSFFTNHPAAYNKNIDYSQSYPVVSVKTDISLLSRVVCNMIINALEATTENGKVKVWLESEGDFLAVCVWNLQEIPSEIANRLFQRNFSTKGQDGRGIGTYSMKLFGEQVLGGRISFTTSQEAGTVFRFSLPFINE